MANDGDEPVLFRNRRSDSEDNNDATPKKSSMLEDIAAEYDHLSTTPPRTRWRKKVKNRNQSEDVSNPGSPRCLRFLRRNTTDNVILRENANENCENKRPKRRSLKTLRGYERDLKLDIGKCNSCVPECVPRSLQVETSSFFKSLQCQPVDRNSQQPDVVIRDKSIKSIPNEIINDDRASFHNTFSMLIRMKNSDKSCKRNSTIEHTWKSELKDVIWLEVCARHAGRTPTQQDVYVLSKRETVPALLQKILDYKFVNDQKCSSSGVWTSQISVLSSDSGIANSPQDDNLNDCTLLDSGVKTQCLCVDCDTCSKAVGKAMHEIEDLLSSLTDAESLYSSSKAMSIQHPIINSPAFVNKIKAMCLWYNMVHHQRLKILIIKKIFIKKFWKGATRKICIPDIAVSPNCNNKNSKQKVQFDLTECIINDVVENSTSSANENSENNDTDDDDNDVIQASSNKENSPNSTNDQNSTETVIDLGVDKLSVNDTNYDSPKSPYESTDSSVGSILSNESGFVSNTYDNNSDDNNVTNTFDVYNLGSLSDLTKLRLYNPKVKSPYRDHIEKMLKVRGLRRALYFLEKLHVDILKKARMTLEKYNDDKQSNENEKDISTPDIDDTDIKNTNDSSDDDFQYERRTRYDVDIDELKNEYLELKRYGAWSNETLEMCLPSYRSIFLFLSTIPIENIHEFLLMRLETKPVKPSALSIKQLIYELREGLAIAVRLRGRFIRHISTALMTEDENSKHRKFYMSVISTFDNTLNEVYKMYLTYLSDWASMEYLPRATLMAEWSFNRYLAQRLYLAATISPLTFCCLTVRQLEVAATRLKTRILELKDAAMSFASREFKTENSNDIKLEVFKICRDIQKLLTEERETALSTAQFARLVSKHLYHNEVFKEHRLNIYKAMACVQSVLCTTIEQLQETTSPKRISELDELDRPSVQSRTKEIVSQAYKFGFEFHKEMYRIINDGITHDNSTNKSRPRFQRADSITIDNNQQFLEDNFFPFTPFTPTTTNSEFVYPTNHKMQSKDEEALKYSLIGNKKSFRSSYQANNAFNEKHLFELGPDDFQNAVPGCESCNKKGFCENELNACERYSAKEFNSKDCDWQMVISKNLIEFSKEWMTFAITRCERGKGRRPRWACYGLEFLMLSCDPQHTKYLSDDEFKKFTSMMDECISHVIGSSAINTSSNSIQRPRISATNASNPLINRMLQPGSPSTPVENPYQMFSNDCEATRQNKQVAALEELDAKRDNSLRKSGAIGNIKHNIESRDHFRPRPVTFKWQRGIKIGQGRFGKVYTVVNIESGQLLAMKEISMGIGDRRSIERAANELKVLEGVVHPNLVRYYGVEIYKEEMLIFMELCVEGSLESLIANCSNIEDEEESSSGLPEQLIRRYTGQLISAVRALHEKSIAHRDIKSGNIFLTEGGNCLKLGDFGCAVKIRANTTAPGELQGHIGTQAYMAPEVFMKSSGHGRAADIWSLGCVVVEMASGKHPWSDCDSNYQIMYKVGTGNRPEIPASLSSEGTDLCIACLQHDSTKRATAVELAQHNFVRVNHVDFY